MIPRCNLHTHTTFCDGKNSVEEIVLRAIELGMDTIGFSGHSPLSFSDDWCMSEQEMKEYVAEVLRMRQKYAGKQEIALGLEYDVLSNCDTSIFDFIIGSVHYVVHDGEYISVDESAEIQKSAVTSHYSGDFYKFAKDYYINMYSLCEKTKCDIVGHFDLLTKFNDGGVLFDENDRRYRMASLEALEFLLAENVIFEINTGAIARGYRKQAYPSEFILRYISEKKGRVSLNSDAHSAAGLIFGFADAVDYAKSCGIKALTVFKNKSFCEFEI